MAYKLNTNTDALRSVLATINTLPEAGSGEIPDGYEDVTQPLADLNAANGGTAANTMSAAVDNTEALASSQEALIAQIATALEGKAAGGGGSTFETCTVRIFNTDETYSQFSSLCYWKLIEGQPFLVKNEFLLYNGYGNRATFDVTLENVLCFSTIYVADVNCLWGLGCIATNGEMVFGASSDSCAFYLAAPANGIATFEMYGDD